MKDTSTIRTPKLQIVLTLSSLLDVRRVFVTVDVRIEPVVNLQVEASRRLLQACMDISQLYPNIDATHR